MKLADFILAHSCDLVVHDIWEQCYDGSAGPLEHGMDTHGSGPSPSLEVVSEPVASLPRGEDVLHAVRWCSGLAWCSDAEIIAVCDRLPT